MSSGFALLSFPTLDEKALSLVVSQSTLRKLNLWATLPPNSVAPAELGGSESFP